MRNVAAAIRPAAQAISASSQSSTPLGFLVCKDCLRWIRSRQEDRAATRIAKPTRRRIHTRHLDYQHGGPAQNQRRRMATVREGIVKTHGPIAEYDARVDSGRLTNDEHQRSLIQSLQDLHEMLVDYRPPKVIRPSIEDLQPRKKSIFSLFSSSKPDPAKAPIPDNVPKGLYMFGDVGSGKTMLMDLFYDTLPPNITSKTRIHFHNFMQDVHKRLHKLRMQHGSSFDAVPFVAADIAASASVLCFDEFQCTDVADAMILRRLMQSLMSHGCVIVTTSNRHPSELYKNGIQRESFIPCINLLQERLRVLNLDSTVDYRKIPRPPSGVYHHPLDKGSKTHADKWFGFLGDFERDPPHSTKLTVWGRQIEVPLASGSCARFTFKELIGRATGAADYIELVRNFESFVVTDVPGMSHRERDWARRFITFIDAVYESRAKLVLTTSVPLTQLFMSEDELAEAVKGAAKEVANRTGGKNDDSHEGQKNKVIVETHEDVNDQMRMLMDDLGLSMTALKSSSIFSGDEEIFAFARALSRLTEMESKEWVERGMGIESKGGQSERDSYMKTRSKWKEDFMRPEP